jgi:dynein heavy chain 1
MAESARVLVLDGQSASLAGDLHEAFKIVAGGGGGSGGSGDVLDVSSNGMTAWATARALYDRRLQSMEKHIVSILAGRLQGARSADEMFSVFGAFNALFFRPAIRNAVNSFRAELVRNVHEDVKRLQNKFRRRYDDSQEKTTADLRDVPPLAGRMMWARQIEHQLTILMKRTADVLGPGWEDHVDGKQLKAVCDELRNYLGTDSLYSAWLSEQLKSGQGRYRKNQAFLFSVESDPRTGLRYLRVNFEERSMVTFKEVAYLDRLLPSLGTTVKTI